MDKIEPEDVCTRSDFLRFLEWLRSELEHQGEGCEMNDSTGSFLEALGARIEDTDAQTSEWRFLATALAAAAIYE
jgi:hypothetical protein